MNLPRPSLTNAIRAGIRRSAGKDLEAQVSAVLDAIDLTEELQASAETAFAIPSAISEPEAPLTPPPNPNSIEIPTAATVRQTPAARVIIPSDSQAATIIHEHQQKQSLRVRSMFLGGARNRMGLTELSLWAQRNFPLTIRVVPTGMDQEIELERNVHTIPLMGERKDRERESTIKIVYKHPKGDSTMEVGLPIRVEDAQRELPDVGQILAGIMDQAREMYKVRPVMIEGRAPKGGDLEQQFRQNSALIAEINKLASTYVRQGASPEAARRKAESVVQANTVGKSGRPITITLADAE